MPPNTKSITESTPGTTQFLNVDLDIFSKWDLQPLVTALGKKVRVLGIFCNKRTYEAHLELAGGNPKSPDHAICGPCKLIRALPPEAREVWDSTKVRQFDVGVEARATQHTYRFELIPETVKAAGELNAQISVTIYPPTVAKLAGSTNLDS